MSVVDDDILRVVAKFTLSGTEDVQNVYHVRANVTGSPTDQEVLDEIADDLNDAYSNFFANLTDELTFDEIEVWNLTAQQYLGVVDWPTMTAGTASDALMPPQTALLCLFGTNTPKSQGRKFLPPMTENANDSDGTPSASILANVAFYVAELIDGITGTGWTGDYGNWNELAERFAPWVLATVRDIFATQRRRYIGSGS